MSTDTLIIFDTTLRDGEQAPGASMTIDEKVRIARRLATLNVDVIEAGFPISSPGQFEAVQRVVGSVEGPVICALARAVEADVRSAGEALAQGQKTRIHTFIPTSDIHIEAKFSAARFGATLDAKRQAILRMIDEAVRQARTYTDDVEFSAEDAGRTDVGFLCEAILTAATAGATTINIPDTTGYCMPDESEEMFRAAKECLKYFPSVVLSAHCHDDLGLAVANSLAAIRGGARQIECTINGIGERAGNAALEEIVMALQVRADRYDVTHRIETRELYETSRMVAVSCGFPVPPNKAIVGRNAFSHEAGIHQHGVLKRRDTYEIMRAEDVGQRAEQIRLGRHSGRHGFLSRLSALGVRVEDMDQEALYARFVELADKKKEIFDRDLLYLVDTLHRPLMEHWYHLEDMAVSVSSASPPEAVVRIQNARTGVTTTERASGDGPVDALFSAIDFAVGTAHDLVNYSIRSVTEGADAIGEVEVVINFAGAHFRGSSRSTDVVRASADAYMQAINRMEMHRNEEENVAFVGKGIIDSFQ